MKGGSHTRLAPPLPAEKTVWFPGGHCDCGSKGQ